jgi:hypothetical protein
MSAAPALFRGFAERRMRTEAGEMHLPQVHVGWRTIASERARHRTMIFAGLPGYGTSSGRPSPVAVGAARGHRRAANDAAR